MTRWDGESNESMYKRCGMGSYAIVVVCCSGMGEIINERKASCKMEE